MARLDNDTYDRKDYYANPSEYYSKFADKVRLSVVISIPMLTRKIAPYLTGLVNGVGWQTGSPRTMTQRDIENLVSSSKGSMRLAAIQDVSCDLKVCLSRWSC
jgi:alpha-aminoadipic semialdehyde synthase